jgi:hypothetical protein
MMFGKPSIKQKLSREKLEKVFEARERYKNDKPPVGVFGFLTGDLEKEKRVLTDYISPEDIELIVEAIKQYMDGTNTIDGALGLNKQRGPKKKKAIDDIEIAKFYHKEKQSGTHESALNVTLTWLQLPNQEKNRQRLKRIYQDAKRHEDSDHGILRRLLSKRSHKWLDEE